jgi:hypothetical protein
MIRRTHEIICRKEKGFVNQKGIFNKIKRRIELKTKNL